MMNRLQALLSISTCAPTSSPVSNPLSKVLQVPLGVRGSLSGLFALLVPCLRGETAQAAAAAAVLARVPALAAPQLLAALAPLQQSLVNGVKPSVPDGNLSLSSQQRLRQDLELRTHLAWLHLRLAAAGAVPAAPDAVWGSLRTSTRPTLNDLLLIRGGLFEPALDRR